jgi:hypothetical protein
MCESVNIEESRNKIYGNSLYCVCNFSINLIVNWFKIKRTKKAS